MSTLAPPSGLAALLAGAAAPQPQGAPGQYSDVTIAGTRAAALPAILGKRLAAGGIVGNFER